MVPKLRRYISTRLMWAVLGSGLLAGGGVIASGFMLFDRLVSTAIDSSLLEAENRFAVLDVMLTRVERDAAENGRSALLELSRRYPSIGLAEREGTDGLKSVASELGVSEIYFIRADGVVSATSFEPDVDMELYALGPGFSSFLKGLRGSGRFASQRLSISIRTSQANSYQYFGPAGADYVIEVSTRLGQAIQKTFPGHDLESLLSLVFNAGDEKAPYIVRAVDILAGNAMPYRSFVHERPVEEGIQALVLASKENGGSASAPMGDETVIVRKLRLAKRGFDYADSGFYAVFTANRAIAKNFALVSTGISLGLIAAAVVAAYFLARSSFERRVMSRLESLEAAMGRVASGESDSHLDDGQGDEISSIGRSAAGMVLQIRERNAELSSFARRLEEEVDAVARRERDLTAALEANQSLIHELDHRVNNNLQLAISLASMQSRAACSDDVRAALDRMRTRLGVVAMVQDLALKSPDMPLVDMARFLDAVAADIAGGFGPLSGRIARSVEADGVAVEPGRAADIGFIAAELIDNAYRHAFRDAGPGSLRIVMARLGDELTLTISDDGSGEPVRGGVGLELAEALASQLKGSLSRETGGGTRFELRIPSEVERTR
ncbi:MAG: hypothetical protein KKA67_06615 [Spirochaetes bacterium]|nr:hypothetical protein [Spirochaetota bacterium]MBU1080191.1 hypothetical protein [Spirochaetota bacterium]